ncbi:putative dihydroneopterin aldolase [Lyophyllum shimeji]|uniref:dihydroneopterin aldolase n=1 Tax=Lyophyllum shimeji TaxID=47721 RepID=A0A9P3PZB7_LYOSH|nr:putative dihydroneopterin aldolase [Lyophyllum shimeji]
MFRSSRVLACAPHPERFGPAFTFSTTIASLVRVLLWLVYLFFRRRMSTSSLAVRPQTDVVFIDTLHLSTDVGLDCWKRARAQPVEVSVYLHLQSSFLTAAGKSDDVLDSVHYGQLSKAISNRVAGSTFGGVENLVAAATDEAFALAGKAATEVRVVVNLPKQILLAEGFIVDITTPSDAPSSPSTRKVSVVNLILPVVIGVNPPERKAKQRVITNITFHEHPGDRPMLGYPEIVAGIVKDIESSAYLTLEKFVWEIARAACLASAEIGAVTVVAQKPSALSFANSSGVEITRRRVDFVNS